MPFGCHTTQLLWRALRLAQSELAHFLIAVLPIAQLTGCLLRRYDTVGLFGRRLDDLVLATKHSLTVTDASAELPRRIIYPTDYFPVSDTKHQKLVEQFVQNLENHLDVSRTEVNLAQLWKDQPPSDSSAASVPLQQYLKKASLADL